MAENLEDLRGDLEALAMQKAGDLDLVLIELELAGRGAGSVMRLLVDRAGGVTVGECAKLSRLMSRVLDDLDLIPFAYRLEVSSPGAGRPFRRREQYGWAEGHQVKVTLVAPVAGIVQVEGILSAVGDQGLVVRTDEGVDLDVPFENIKEACRSLVL